MSLRRSRYLIRRRALAACRGEPDDRNKSPYLVLALMDEHSQEVDMKQVLTAAIASLIIAAGSTSAMAVKTRTVTGAAIGAGVGAVVAGPPGAVVGGVGGAIIGGPDLPRAHRHCWVRKGERYCRTERP
jgi:hypothetical protein